MPRAAQLSFLPPRSSAYGGTLLRTRRGRTGGRPLSTRETMHLVLRSSQARGEWSFRKPAHERRIRQIVAKFARRNGVKVLSLVNVGNHLHFHVQLTHRQLYRPFIRGMTAAIAMAVTGASRWRKGTRARFWDYRPFTRIVRGFRAFLTLRDYMAINRLEGAGVPRERARWLVTRAPPPRRGGA